MVYFAHESAVWIGLWGGIWGMTHLCSPISGALTGMTPSGWGPAKPLILHKASPHGQLGLPSFNVVASGWSGFLSGGSEVQEQGFQDTWVEALVLFMIQPWKSQNVISATCY